MQLSALKEYHKNPRRISEDRFKHLQTSLEKLGDLGGIVVNGLTNEVIGGNQRTKTFLQERDRYEIMLLENYKQAQADGTVARGYIVKDKGLPTEQRFAYREVEWTEEQCEEANIVANKITGMWDYDVLANKFNLDALMKYGFSETDLGLLPKPDALPTMDKDALGKSLDSYLDGNIKQIVLYFKAEEFDGICALLDRVMNSLDLKNHTEVVELLLNEWAHANPATEQEGA